MWDSDKSTNNVWLTIADLPKSLHALAFDSKEHVSDLAAANMRKIPAGTLLVSFKLTLGRLAYAGTDLFSNEAIASLLDIDENKVQQRFLYWALSAFDWDKAAEGDQKIKGKTLNKAKLKRIPIPLPPLEEQRRIVAVLDEAFEGLDRARTRVEANLEDSKEIFVSSVERLLNTDRSDWESGNFSEVVGQVFTGPFGSLLHKSDYVENETPIVNPENIVEGKIVPDSTKTVTRHILDKLPTYRLKVGDIVIARRGEMGRCAVVEQEQAGWLCGTGSFFVRTRVNVEPELVVQMLRTPSMVRKLTSIATGTTMSNLSNKSLASLQIDLPNREMQLRLLETIENLDQETRSIAVSYNARCSHLRDLRQSILQRAFAGELT